MGINRVGVIGSVAFSVLAVSAITTLLSACASDASRTFVNDVPDAQVPIQTTQGVDGGPGFDDGGKEVCRTQCTDDFRQVKDCHGKLTQTCPADQACGQGVGCVPACDAAAKNRANIGCDYYSVIPDVIDGRKGNCHAAFFANTWTTPIRIEVERAGKSLDVSSFARIARGAGDQIRYDALPGGTLPPGEVAILFLAQHNFSETFFHKCPEGIVPATNAVDAAIYGSGVGDGFHIKTSAPVVGYDIYPYGGASTAVTSATLLLPTSAWDTNYIGVNAFQKGDPGRPFIQLLAREDGTNVTINPVKAIQPATGVVGTAAHVPITYSLKKGQYVQLSQDEELSGSVIQSDKPVALWGGDSCMTAPAGILGCDAAHQQIPPVRALGNEYVAVRHRNRVASIPESQPWRIVGAINGTTLTYEPAPPPNAPTTLSSGQVADFWTEDAFTVRSQDQDHPFYMAGYMTGTLHIRGTAGYGDPEFVNVIPTDQYLNSYVFYTDPTYPETSLIVVRRKDKGLFADVELDCAGKLESWTPVGTAGTFEYSRVDLVAGNFQPQGRCNNGRHEMKSASPFTVTVWGWGNPNTANTASVSYAYPAGAGIRPINSVVIPAIK